METINGKKTSKDYKFENIKALREAKEDLEAMLKTMKGNSKSNTKEK